MHELSVAVGIVELCNEHAGNARVRSVRLKVGTLCCLQPESLRFCFQVAAEGTALQLVLARVVACAVAPADEPSESTALTT